MKANLERHLADAADGAQEAERQLVFLFCVLLTPQSENARAFSTQQLNSIRAIAVHPLPLVFKLTRRQALAERIRSSYRDERLHEVAWRDFTAQVPTPPLPRCHITPHTMPPRWTRCACTSLTLSGECARRCKLATSSRGRTASFAKSSRRARASSRGLKCGPKFAHCLRRLSPD